MSADAACPCAPGGFADRSRAQARAQTSLLDPMPSYRYEIATGLLSDFATLEIGDQIEVAGSRGIVRAIEPMLGERELRVVIELLPPRA